jgi:signal transduction histidine kinase/putative methionine-R-sulfoxide reductase with GAF domain
VVSKSEPAIAKVQSRGGIDLRGRVAELEEALAHQTRISSALRDIGQALGTTLDLDQVLELILVKITEAVDADRATLYLLDDARGELVSRIAHGSDVRSIRLAVGEGIAGHVAKTGRAITVRDAYKDPRFSPQWDVLSGYRTRSILAAPLKNHLGKTIGVVQVLNKKNGEFTDDDADILAAIATQAAVSIDNSRLFLETVQKNLQLVETKEQLLHRVRDLKLLFSLESAMARAHSLEELFMAVLGEAMRSCEARAAAVALREPGESEGEESPFLYLVDDKHRKLRRFPLREGQGLIGWSMMKGEVVITTDAPNDERTDTAFDELVGFYSQTALIVPLEGEERSTLGAIALYNKRDAKGFSGEDRSLLELIAANASTAIRLQMAREQHEREERLTTIGRLLSAVIHDLKTPLTVISGYVQLMQAAESKKKRAEYAEAALKQFDHISAMQREVLEFARGERNVLVRKVYLQKFFEEARAAVEPQLKRDGIDLVIDLQDKGTARFDEGKILRVIHNLARNAVEAMQPQGGGRFSIRVTRAHKGEPEEELVLTFTDTGPGIPKEIEHRLFRSFVTANKKGGTGLGLAIVKKIAEDHGGTVTVRSTKRGATFELRLPQAPRE